MDKFAIPLLVFAEALGDAVLIRLKRFLGLDYFVTENKVLLRQILGF